MTTEPPRASMSALISVSGLPPSPSGRAGDRADEAFGRLAPARFVGQMPEPDEDVSARSPTPDGVAPSCAWRGRAPGTSAASFAVRKNPPAPSPNRSMASLAKPARGFEIAGLAARLE